MRFAPFAVEPYNKAGIQNKNILLKCKITTWWLHEKNNST
jgi:hypothetical protein